jgi:hypothetical protein
MIGLPILCDDFDPLLVRHPDNSLQADYNTGHFPFQSLLCLL